MHNGKYTTEFLLRKEHDWHLKANTERNEPLAFCQRITLRSLICLYSKALDTIRGFSTNVFPSLRPVSTQTFGSLCIEHQRDWKGSLPPSSLLASLTATLWYPGGYSGARGSGTEKQWMSPVCISGFCGSLHQFCSFKLCKGCLVKRKTREWRQYIYTTYAKLVSCHSLQCWVLRERLWELREWAILSSFIVGLFALLYKGAADQRFLCMGQPCWAWAGAGFSFSLLGRALLLEPNSKTGPHRQAKKYFWKKTVKLNSVVLIAHETTMLESVHAIKYRLKNRTGETLEKCKHILINVSSGNTSKCFAALHLHSLLCKTYHREICLCCRGRCLSLRKARPDTESGAIGNRGTNSVTLVFTSVWMNVPSEGWVPPHLTILHIAKASCSQDQSQSCTALL